MSSSSYEKKDPNKKRKNFMQPKILRKVRRNPARMVCGEVVQYINRRREQVGNGKKVMWKKLCRSRAGAVDEREGKRREGEISSMG